MARVSFAGLHEVCIELPDGDRVVEPTIGAWFGAVGAMVGGDSVTGGPAIDGGTVCSGPAAGSAGSETVPGPVVVVTWLGDTDGVVVVVAFAAVVVVSRSTAVVVARPSLVVVTARSSVRSASGSSSDRVARAPMSTAMTTAATPTIASQRRRRPRSPPPPSPPPGAPPLTCWSNAARTRSRTPSRAPSGRVKVTSAGPTASAPNGATRALRRSSQRSQLSMWRATRLRVSTV